MPNIVKVKNLSASLEDYLESIFHIVAEKSAARAKDISDRMKVNRSSVTGALHALAQKGLINYAPYDVITLTPQGKSLAEDVVRRHEILQDFFVKILAADTAAAAQAACKMEHAVSPEIIERFCHFIEFMEICPRGGPDWVEKFDNYYQHEKRGDSCEKCISLCLEQVRKNNMRDSNGTSSTVCLKDLKPSGRGKIVKIAVKGEIRKRLMEMGVTTGTVVEVERVAPLGDPIEIKIRGYHLSLRKVQAKGIFVEPVEPI